MVAARSRQPPRAYRRGVAATGIALLGAHKLATGANATFVGFLLVVVAALSWAMGNVIAKHAAGKAEVNMLGMVVWSSLAAPLPLFAASYAFEGGSSSSPRSRTWVGSRGRACSS